MSKHTAVGIDIGTYQVKVVILETPDNDSAPRIIGTGIAESRGLRHGYILNSHDVVKSIKSAVHQAEKIAGTHVKSAYVSVGGIGLQSVTHTASVVVTKADQEITELDMTRALDLCEKNIPKAHISNRKIIHKIPLEYKVDGKVVLGRPQGIHGSRLEVKMIFITTLEQHYSDVLDAVNDAGIEVIEIVASPIAASIVTLSKTQKYAGCLLANIGAETVSIVVFEENLPISLEVFPIGSNDITNAIALHLRIPLDIAEGVKRGKDSGESVSRKKLDDIVTSKLSDIFELIENHLKKINKNGLLPAGIIITGGGSGIASIEDLARGILKLPSKIALLSGNGKEGVKDSSWSVAYGLAVFGLKSGSDPISSRPQINILQKIKAIFSQFLP